MYAPCRQERREGIVRLLEYLKDIMYDTYDTLTFIVDPLATVISAVQSMYSHALIILCSFDIAGALFRRVSALCTNYLL